MSLEKDLQKRSSVCELCGSSEGLKPYEIAPSNGSADQHILACGTCHEQMEDKDKMDANHWRCLNDSMWSTVPAVQVMAWRMLNRLKAEGWPQDLLDMLYLDEDTMNWAQATGEGEDEEDKVKHIDSNGVELQAGDSVVLIKDLKVSGAGFTAKRGAAVRRISLVADDPTHIEGKVEGQQIYILTKWVKKI
ncbi:MAG: PhnA domain-containing protein [Marinifilum sp.]|jgi:protein PhnA|nr:PhnA domain-containing protein [Marinifilum sp.]